MSPGEVLALAMMMFRKEEEAEPLIQSGPWLAPVLPQELQEGRGFVGAFRVAGRGSWRWA